MEKLFTSITHGRRVKLVQNLVDTQETVTHTLPNELISITNCVNSTIEVNSVKCSKIQVNSCKNSVISIACGMITATAEIINCENCVISFKGTINDISTVTLDKTKTTAINLVHENDPPVQLKLLSSSDCQENVVYVKKLDVSHQIVFDQEEIDDYIAVTSIQYQSVFYGNFQNLITEQIIREGCGYVTTRKDKEINDAKQKEIERRIEELVGSSIEIREERRKEADQISRSISEKITRNQSKTQTNPSDLFSQISKFNKDKLQPTETKYTSLASVVGDMGDFEPVIEKKQVVEEIFDSDELVRERAKIVAEHIENGKHVCVYTGAGISTSASIPDYRGPQGIWTLKNAGRLHEAKMVNIEQVYPTYCHYAIALLVQKGLVKHLISTNVDGLHRRSGVPKERISELHGNSYREVCGSCGAEYLRSFDVCKTVLNPTDHYTQRRCTKPQCNGRLKDTIIHFGECLSSDELNPAYEQSGKADVSLVLGTSMSVQPACELPTLNKRSKLFIVNLQKTPFDHKAELVIHSRTDMFMQLVMEHLGLHDQVDMSYDELAILRELNPDEIVPESSNNYGVIYSL